MFDKLKSHKNSNAYYIMICVPITARSIEDTISELSLASKHADIDIIELRLDYISEMEDA